jgi:predicted nucleotidyltransferase
MDKEKVIHLLRTNKEKLRTLGIRSISLFGSIARGDSTHGSDIDLLVDLEPPHTFDRYMQALFFLEDLLGCSVDLVMQETLKPRIRPYIEQEAIRVA